ncbi:MAG TPA: DUF4097 family beta strand repeat-containing protein [Rudaea sp.]|nr:DUF4097 family beta strand repeat-containing protein [Rudaea sp.]
MRILAGLILAAASSAALASHDCKFSADRNLDIDPAGLKTLALVLGASDAHVEGVAGMKRIEVRGKACASDEQWLKDLTVDQERSADRVRVTTSKNQGGVHISLFGSSYAYIDLDVRMPADLALEVDAGSGDANVTDVASLSFSSGSGDLNAHHVAGAVAVRVGSGDAIMDDVGSLSVERAGSGDIRATNAHGEVKVGHIGSGDMNFSDVKGGVHIESVGSGDVVVRRAGGDVEIGSIGSGDVTVDGVGGNFIVHSAGSGDLRHHQVTGKVQVPKRHEDD